MNLKKKKPLFWSKKEILFNVFNTQKPQIFLKWLSMKNFNK